METDKALVNIIGVLMDKLGIHTLNVTAIRLERFQADTQIAVEFMGSNVRVRSAHRGLIVPAKGHELLGHT